MSKTRKLGTFCVCGHQLGSHWEEPDTQPCSVCGCCEFSAKPELRFEGCYCNCHSPPIIGVKGKGPCGSCSCNSEVTHDPAPPYIGNTKFEPSQIEREYRAEHAKHVSEQASGRQVFLTEDEIWVLQN